MESKWIVINSMTGWKAYAYNPKNNQLYLTSFISSTIDVIENVTKKEYDMFELIVGTHDRKKIEHWVKNKEMANGLSTPENTALLVKDGAYNVPKEYYYGLEQNQIKDIIKKTYYKETQDMNIFKKNRFIKNKLKKALEQM